ncbi:uncharacterized protein LOC122644811 [Telopea speciosissima]|uniref:uncharacterized protein LOC122644811 n=1 Tax=Telopea speciosissima TaxID=54955 RepID=UPI001CC799CD|nr:uncharacterized protein LOC122644811 [Telopea speciosissima]
MASVLDSIAPVITLEMNTVLCSIPTLEEMRVALFSMSPLKSPGIDGFPPAFFQRYWDIIKDDLYGFVTTYFETGVMSPCLNETLDILDVIVSPYQSAFIPNRAISDNVYIAHELFHYIHKRKKGRKKFIALKLDMKKAYDRLEWPFIEHMLLRLGFQPHWVENDGIIKGFSVRNRAPAITH